MKKFSVFFSLISGILTGISLSFENVWPLVFFSLIPLYLSLVNTKGAWDVYKQVFFYSVAYYFTDISWLLKISEFLPIEKFKIPVLLFAILILAVFQSFYFFLPLCFLNNVAKTTTGRIFIFSGLYIFGEWLSELIPFFNFPWCRLATALVNFKVLIGSSSLFGSLFISFIICVINACISEIIINWKEYKKCIKISLLGTAVFAGNLLYGIGYSQYLSMIVSDNPSVEISMIKSSSGAAEKWSDNINQKIDNYIADSEKSLTGNTRAVVWSETAINVNLDKNEDVTQKINNFCKKHNISLITGVIIHDNGEKYNSVVVFNPEEVITEYYSKQILVPFGEFIPFENYFKEKYSWLKDYKSYSYKKKSFPLKSKIGNVGSVICYESVFPKVSRLLSKNDADFLIIVSNDSWFDGTHATYQHFCHSVLRAVENGKYLARCSTGGITAIISPDGTFITNDNPEFLRGEIKPISQKTLYTFIGDIIIIYPLGIMIYPLYRRIQKSKDK